MKIDILTEIDEEENIIYLKIPMDKIGLDKLVRVCELFCSDNYILLDGDSYGEYIIEIMPKSKENCDLEDLLVLFVDKLNDENMDNFDLKVIYKQLKFEENMLKVK
jgi:hypothetical protein